MASALRRKKGSSRRIIVLVACLKAYEHDSTVELYDEDNDGARKINAYHGGSHFERLVRLVFSKDHGDQEKDAEE